MKPSPPLDEQLQAGLRGDFARGQEIADQLKLETPHCNRAKFNRAWYEMRHGRLHEGLCLLDTGRWEKAFGDSPLPTTKSIYRDESLEGRHLLLCSEGGLGDEVINVRFATDFARRGAKVTVTCDPGLASVFARVEGVASVVRHRAAPDVHHDYWVPAMSAARILGYEYKDLTGEPYLSVDSRHREKWRAFFSQKAIFGSRPRIGLRFHGNPQFEHEQHRRFPSQGLIDAVSPLSWISLQKETTPLALDTWEDTLAVIDQLDLIITSCTSVAHAAAALGKPTWILVPILPYYLWALPGSKSPWYKSVRLFRQKFFGRWDEVFDELKEELKKWGQ